MCLRETPLNTLNAGEKS